MAKHKSTPKRHIKQKKKGRYQRLREDLQIDQVIPVSPEGAVRSEAVNPALQGEQKIPSLDRDVIRKGWEVPDEVKKKVIERLAEPFFEDKRVVVDREGNAIELPPDRYLLKENAKVLVAADQRQYERDHPEEAGKAKGRTEVNVGVQVNDPYAVYKKALEEVEVDEVEQRINGEPPAGPGTNPLAEPEVLPGAAGHDK